ncbi:MAG TPA: mechanosensitive ion channel [Cyclobacteriaceae bacterium]|nr:mechanosensitive ion channel family protein [Cyclobacteriaceae bacterium]HRK55391.1 mechanosensitive ion channel [Cyclobacteriaceae bacterium]
MKDWIEQLATPEWLQTLIWVIVIVIIIRFAFIFLIRGIQKSKQDKDSKYRTKKILDAASYVVIILALLIAYSRNLAGLSVALGVAGAGIAFALQEVIASVAGWLALMFGNFYRTGDRVQLGGIKGDVIDIGVLRTTLMETGQWVDGDLYNGRIVRVANSFVFKEPVFNYSGDFPFLWDEIKIPIQYGSDYVLAKSILEKIANEHLRKNAAEGKRVWNEMVKKYLIEDAQLEPMVSLIANDNWVEFTIRYVVSYKKRRMTKNELFLAILKEVEATNGKVRFGSATFEMVGMPELQIKMKPD